MPNEQNQTAAQKAEQYTRNFRNDTVRNFIQNTENIAKLEDSKTLDEFYTAITKITDAITNNAGKINEKQKSDKALMDSMAKVQSSMEGLAKDIDAGKINYKDSAKVIKEVITTLSKNQGKLSKEANAALKELTDNFGDLSDAAFNLTEGLKKDSETLNQALKRGAGELGQSLRKFRNFLNLNQMATGGRSVSELRDIQHSVKVDLGINQNEFMKLQGSLIETNRDLGNELGLSFKDSIKYLSSIKDYNFRSYSQAKAMYTQVSLGTKYLGLSTASLNGLVKATNAIADDSFMNRQLALMSALGSDSNVSENMGDIAEYLGSNATKVAGRYSNYQDMLTNSVAIKTTADALFGGDSGLISNLMAEIMGASDFSQLSSATQTLLAYTGQASNVWQQMRNGNVDFNSIITGTLSGVNGLNQYQRTTLENLGLGDWVTMGGDYSRNQQQFNELLSNQNNILSSIDISTEEGMREAQERLAQGKDDRTLFEKVAEGIFNFFGIQNQNWSAVLGIIQSIQTAENLLVTYSTFTQNGLLKAILASINAQNTKQGLETFENKGIFSRLFGGGTTGGTAGKAAGSLGSKLLGGGMLASSAMMGISDAITMSNNGGGFGGAMRGMFLGTGNSSQSTGEKVGSVLGNSAKWGLAGAGAAMLLGGPVGWVAGGAALLGGLLGFLGTTMADNTNAIEENTDIITETNDSVTKNSAMYRKYIQYVKGENNTGSAPITYGTGSVTDSSAIGDTNYPWPISSGYGYRWGKLHAGIDFKMPIGTKIGMPVDGQVVYSKNDPTNTWNTTRDPSSGTGAYILGDDGIKYVFWHLSQLAVSNGQRVRAGQLVGLSGNTGFSSGPHLHFGTFSNGSAVDPSNYINSYLSNPGSVNVSTDTSTLSNTDYSSSITNGKSLYLSKDAVFSPASSSSTGDVNVSDSPNYATSNDIDRLISTMVELNKNQKDQREFLQALAGKNTFVLH